MTRALPKRANRHAPMQASQSQKPKVFVAYPKGYDRNNGCPDLDEVGLGSASYAITQVPFEASAFDTIVADVKAAIEACLTGFIDFIVYVFAIPAGFTCDVVEMLRSYFQEEPVEGLKLEILTVSV